jgi:hypothetical protein
LLPDHSLRIANVSEGIWQFSVSGYQVLYRWLRARNGNEITAVLQRNILDTVGRIDESLHLFDEAYSILAEAVEASLTRAQIGLPSREEAEVVEPEDVDEAV